jgi:hypothetical protein
VIEALSARLNCSGTGGSAPLDGEATVTMSAKAVERSTCTCNT